MRILIVISLFLLSLESGSIEITNRESINTFTRLIHAESSGKSNALSKVGAIGICQITTNLLSHYNWVKGSQIRPSELHNDITNIRVSTWYLDYLDKFFVGYSEKDRNILKYSAYNMGQYRTIFTNDKISNGVLIYRPYVIKIVGLYQWHLFKSRNDLLWRGKNIDLYSISEVN